MIVPIYKSGNKDNPDNYRGISLLSVLGKVFAYILNRRLTLWADANNKIAEEQGGFRSGYSTMDNIFVLYAVVQKYLLRKSGKVYVCFVDFRKAFDTINRNILWNVLRKNGIGGRMLHCLQSMYESVNACVRGGAEHLSNFFECPLGVRQGCVLSPTLFSFLINELALEVAQNGDFGIQLTPDVVQILILLFADDVVLTSFCAAGLQRQINCLKTFADNFSMSVNLSKTKVIVFRKGGFLAANERWKYGNEKLEVVNSYKYLGLHFTTKLSLNSSVQELATKAKSRTVQILRCLWRLGNAPRDVFFKLFDAQVTPVLLYGAEIWGFQRFDIIEKAHLFACKRYLNVAQNTPNALLYGDLGRHPMYISSAVRCIKFWLRILTLPSDRLPKKAYNMLLQMEEAGKKSWAYLVKEILLRNGFGCVWTQQGVGCVKTFLSIFRQRLIDQYQQDWHSVINDSERFEFYASFKHVIGAEKYLDTVQLRCFRTALVRFRLGISCIRVHKLRYSRNVLPHHLVCPVCKNAVEDERHVLTDCREYDVFRLDVLALAPAANRQFVNIATVMTADDEESIAQLSRFLYKVFKKRNLFLND